MNVIFSLILSTISGLSTVIGGFIVFFNIKRVEEFITFSLSFSMSVMINISIFELIPDSVFQFIRYHGIFKGFIYSIFIFIIGIILVKMFNKIVDRYKYNNLYRLGVLSMIALMIHNIPEGIATFMFSYKDISLGINLSIAIMMHNIPEGISISVPIYYSTGSRKRGVTYSFISGFAEPIGALITYILLRKYITDISLSVILLLVAGIMISLSIEEIFKEVLKYNKDKYIIYGYVSGIILVLINHFII